MLLKAKIITVVLIVLLFVGLTFSTPISNASQQLKTKLPASKKYQKDCRRIGQKFCKVVNPGYSGRCLKANLHGYYVIFYKRYPRKIYKIVCRIKTVI